MRNAEQWVEAALAAEARAQAATSAAERQRHDQEVVDALAVAASLGSHDAALELGIHYQHADSDLRPARLELAEHWLRQAVKADDGTGMLALGTLLTQLGREVEGRRWLRAALAHGDGGAACHLARPLEASAPSRALRLYLQGAKLGDPFAAACAGRLLEARGTRPALLEAKRLYARALEKHLPDAAADVERVSRRLEAPGPARSAMTRKRR